MNNSELTSSGYFFRYQFADYLGGSLAGCKSAGHDIISRNGIQYIKKLALADKNIRFIEIDPGSITGQFLIKRIRFFFGHIRHFLYLLFRGIHTMRQKAFPAFHCMKYIQPLVIDTIIHNFYGIAVGIKAYKQILVFIIFQKTIANRMHKRPFNIGFGKTMLKSRLVIDDTRFHICMENIA